MIKNLPVYRYDLFIKVFEKEVAAAQRRIEGLRGMEQVYNLFKEAMELARLPNEQTVTVYPSYLQVAVRATRTDTLAMFDDAAAAVGKRLHQAALHDDGVPSIGFGIYSCCVTFTWYARGKVIHLQVSIPDEGLADLSVSKSIKKSECEVFVMRRVERPTYVAPASFKSIAAENEILF